MPSEGPQAGRASYLGLLGRPVPVAWPCCSPGRQDQHTRLLSGFALLTLGLALPVRPVHASRPIVRFDNNRFESTAKCSNNFGNVTQARDGLYYNVEMGPPNDIRKYLIQSNWNPLTVGGAGTPQIGCQLGELTY